MRVIGIDLGTTNSVVAAVEAGDPAVLENAEGSRLTPSVVAVNPQTGERLVGALAKRQAVTNPEHTIYSIGRLMGRTYDDPIVQETSRRVPYRVTRAPDGDARVAMGGREYAPPEIAAMILRKLKADAEATLGEKVTEAVITVPASFNEVQRRATKDAGRMAGLEVRRLINQSTAAALAYGLDKKKDELIAVYDLGGGTFDISILQLGEGVFEVKSTNGDTRLGGDDFDHCFVSWLADAFEREHGTNLQTDRVALLRLKEAAESAKIELSTTMQAEIGLPFIAADASGPKHLAATLTRPAFEQLVADLVARTEAPSRRALVDSGLEAGGIDEVLLVGGQTRMPAVRELVRKIFGKEPHKGLNPDEGAAIGAAIQAGVLMGVIKDVLLLDVTPFSLGVQTKGGAMIPLIPRNTTIPTRKSAPFAVTQDDQSRVEIHVLQGATDDEAISLGSFIFDGVSPAAHGAPQLEVTFDIDANGILHVSARDNATGNERGVTIQSAIAKDG